MFHVIVVLVQLFDCDATFVLLVAAVRFAETGRIHESDPLSQTCGAVQTSQVGGLFAPFEQAGAGSTVTVKFALLATSPVEDFDASTANA